MKLNLGCGDKKLEGFVNVDICGTPDVATDLSVFPWPFESESADEIYSEHFLEHVKDFEATLFEIHRILKPNGVLHFKVPHFKSPFFPWHVHLQSFSGITCTLLCKQLPYVFKGRHLFKDGAVKFNYPYFSKVKSRVFEKLANKNWMMWECIGLPVQEIEFWAHKV